MEKLLESAFSFVPRMTNVKGLRAILHRWRKEVRNLQGLVYFFLSYIIWGFILFFSLISVSPALFVKMSLLTKNEKKNKTEQLLGNEICKYM